MMNIAASQERGWIGKFPEIQVAGKWRWSLLGPVPQTLEEDTGAGVVFTVDETLPANLGEYTVSVQRLDVSGGAMGDSQSSAPFVISGDVPPVLVDVEIAGPISVTISKS
jgi:hypothetical protein